MRRVLAVLIAMLVAVWPLLLPQPTSANPCANNVQGNNLSAQAGHKTYVSGNNKQYNDQDADGGKGGKGDSGSAYSGDVNPNIGSGDVKAKADGENRAGDSHANGGSGGSTNAGDQSNSASNSNSGGSGGTTGNNTGGDGGYANAYAVGPIQVNVAKGNESNGGAGGAGGSNLGLGGSGAPGGNNLGLGGLGGLGGSNLGLGGVGATGGAGGTGEGASTPICLAGCTPTGGGTGGAGGAGGAGGSADGAGGAGGAGGSADGDGGAGGRGGSADGDGGAGGVGGAGGTVAGGNALAFQKGGADAYGGKASGGDVKTGSADGGDAKGSQLNALVSVHKGGSADGGKSYGGDVSGDRDAKAINIQKQFAKSGDATSGIATGGAGGAGGTNSLYAGDQRGHNVDVAPATASAGTLTVSGDPCKMTIQGDVIGSQVLNGVNTIQNSVMQNTSSQIGNAAAGAINLGFGATNGLPEVSHVPQYETGMAYGKANVNINLNPNNNQNTNFISIGGSGQ